jgi:nitrogen regulatory protein PII
MTLMTEKRTLLTVITESAIEEILLKDLEKLGVRGYTVSDARGRGSRGVRDATWGEVSNIRLEVICTRVLAEIALNHIQKHYYDNYAMVAFLQDVEILRPEKF